MKLLVTGGAGFIGSCFIRQVLDKHNDYEVINLDKLTYAGNLDNLKSLENCPRYQFVQADINDKEIVDDLTKKVDWVVNFAAETHVDRSIEAPDVFIETNIKGTLNLLNFSLKNNVQKYLQVSTDEVYGSLGKTGYFYETTPLAPNSPYSASKASADMLALSYYKTYGLPVLITRCSNNYGPYQYPEKLIPFFILKLLKGENVPLYGDGLNVRDWLYVYDHADAIDLVLNKGRIGEVYNIGGHNEKTNFEITKIILNEMGFDESKIQYVKDRLGHDRRYAIANDKIKSELGFEPKHNFAEAIKTTIEWYKNNQDWIENIERKRK